MILLADDMQRHASGVEAYDAALTSLDKALAIDPRYYDALANRAYALLLLAKSEESLRAYDELIAIDPTDATNIASKAIVFYNMQRYPDAVSAIRDALQVDRNNEKAREIWPVIEAFAIDGEETDTIKRLLSESDTQK
jgi:tetratricopeptide (TPR) repeat protein